MADLHDWEEGGSQYEKKLASNLEEEEEEKEQDIGPFDELEDCGQRYEVFSAMDTVLQQDSPLRYVDAPKLYSSVTEEMEQETPRKNEFAPVIQEALDVFVDEGVISQYQARRWNEYDTERYSEEDAQELAERLVSSEDDDITASYDQVWDDVMEEDDSGEDSERDVMGNAWKEYDEKYGNENREALKKMFDRGVSP